MPLQPGARLGVYEISALVGAGGMGEIYKATDTTLKRQVAIKVLPDSVARDADRLARLQREAEILAALNHPHIAQVFGFEKANGASALVMELVEGPTLADRIAQGPLPLPEAVAIARQIVDALEAAHEQGIIHRDLKPANIKVRPDGTVKVLDFGLAKALDQAPGLKSQADGHPANSPTVTSPAMTMAGMILGTAAYMSPEQAAGKPVDKRSDVWAFGVVLMEMLTGRQTFGGETVSHVIASVLQDAPDWTSLPAGTPTPIRTLLRRCLEKDRRRRLADISDARFELDEALNAASELPTVAPNRAPARAWMWAAIGVMAGALVAATATWTWGPVAQPDRPARFNVTFPSNEPLAYRGPSGNLAISPDGSFIVYSAAAASGQGTRLMIRSIDDLAPKPLPDTENAHAPFVSPDGRMVGFVSSSGAIEYLPVAGGNAVPISQRLLGGTPRGATWGPDDRIVFANANPDIGLVSVRLGGEPEELTKANRQAGEVDHVFPSFLPGGEALLFTILTERAENTRVAVLELATGQHRILIEGASHARFMDPGYLVYAAGGLLHAVRFDAERLQVIGEPMALGDRVMARPTGVAEFAVSSTGTLTFIPERIGEAISPRALVWVNRQGQEEPTGAPLRTYGSARVSPDGSRAVIAVYDDALDDLWIWDFTRRTLERVTRSPGSDMSPMWTRDGRHVIWATAPPGGGPTVYRQAADGTGAPEQLAASQGFQYPTSMTPDGRQLLIQQGPAGPTRRVRSLDLSSALGPAASSQVVMTNAWSPEISPDGRWLAYQSNESGQDEIYVRPYPNVDAARILISTAGGTRPAWAPSGRELYYLDAAGLLTAVPLTVSGGSLKAGLPTTVSRTKYFAGVSSLGIASLRAYDIAPDGQRLLVIKESGASERDAASSLVVNLHFAEIVKARLSPQ